MAFAPDDPNAPQNQNPVNNPMAQPPQTASGIGAGAGGVSSPQGVTATLSATKAPPVTNLGDYLKANAPQVNDTANRIAEGLNTQAGQIQTDLNSGQAAFDTAIGGGSVAPNPYLVGRAAADPTAFVKNPDDVAAFAKQRDATYTGPTDFTTSDIFSQLSGEVAKAAGQAPNASNPNDLWGVASSQETNPTYGMTALDTLLLQQNPDAVSTLNTARAPFGTFSKSLDDLVAKENAGAKSAQTATAAAASGAVAPFTAPGGVVPTFAQTLRDALAKSDTSRTAYNAKVDTDLTTADAEKKALQGALDAAKPSYAPNVTNMAGSQANADPMLAKIASEIDPTSFLNSLQPFLGESPIVGSATPAGVATPDQYAYDAALEALLGPLYSPNLDQTNAGQAGTFSVPALSGPVPDTSGMVQYINDIASLYGKPYGLLNANPPGGWQNATPAQAAQAVLTAMTKQGQGVNPDADTIAALQRLVANSYAGR